MQTFVRPCVAACRGIAAAPASPPIHDFAPAFPDRRPAPEFVSIAAPARPASASSIARSAARGAVALGVRQALVQGLNIAGAVVLARVLSPAEFGVYAVVTFVLAFLVAFGDVGLGASLVQQHREPSLRDYRAVFTAQQLLVGLAVLALWLLAPWITGAYGRPPGEVWLFRSLALALFFTSFQTIALIRVERHLAFEKVALVEVAQAVVFNALAVGLALRGVGVMSFAIALVARSLVGAVLANSIAPWPIGFRWDWPRVRAHLRFGLPYQGISLVSLLKDSISPVLIGLLLGARQVGFVNWAGMVAAYPVLALMVLQRVYLPAFSRMSVHPKELRRFVERVLRLTNTVVAPLSVLTLVLIEPATRLVFGAKWLPALPLFFLFWTANLFVPTATPLLGLLNALGESRTALRFATLWMAGTWLLGAPLVLAFGAVGFAFANVAVQLSNVWLFRVAQARVGFRVLAPALHAWLAAGVAGGATWLLAWSVMPNSLVELGVCAAGGAVVYLGMLSALDPASAARIASHFRSSGWRLASR